MALSTTELQQRIKERFDAEHPDCRLIQVNELQKGRNGETTFCEPFSSRPPERNRATPNVKRPAGNHHSTGGPGAALLRCGGKVTPRPYAS